MQIRYFKDLCEPCLNAPEKWPNLYHGQQTLSMTKVTNCPYNVYSWADKSKMLLCI